MKVLPYNQGRDLIKNGDIVTVLRPKKFSLFASTISFFTGSPIYHTGIAVWLTNETTSEKRLFLVEAMDSRRRIISLSEYSKQDLHVLAMPNYVNFQLFADDLLAKINVAPYSYLKAIWSGIKQYCWLPTINEEGEFCSEMVAKMWKKGGFPITDTCINPAEMERIFVNVMHVEYRCWLTS
jgi:hypothetical protein